MPGPSAPQPKQQKAAGSQEVQTFVPRENHAFNPARQVGRDFWMKHGVDRSGDYY